MTLKRVKAVLTTIMIAVAFPAVSFATPSSQIWIPSTDTQPYGTFHLGVDNYTTIFTEIEDGGNSSPVGMGLTMGVADTEIIGVEFGIDIKEASDSPLYINAKLQVKEDSIMSFFPSIAIGGYDFGTDSEINDYNILYTMLGKTLPIFGRISVGYYYGNDDLLLDKSDGKDNSGFMLSFDRTLAEIDDRLWISVDHMSGENLYGATSAGFSWRFSPHISALLGYVVYNESEVAGEDQLTIQFDMDF